MTEGEVRAAKGLDYWAKRYERHHERVPGTSNKKNQNEEYSKKIRFISERIPRNLKTLDYGCGIGWYSSLFRDYLGYDPIDRAVELAKERNEEKTFTTNEEDAIRFKPELVLFATVLQHIENPKEVVDKFKDSKYIVMFENISQELDKNYIFFRESSYYVRLVEKTHPNISYESYDHIYLNNLGKQCQEPHILIVAMR